MLICPMNATWERAENSFGGNCRRVKNERDMLTTLPGRREVRTRHAPTPWGVRPCMSCIPDWS